MTVNIPLLRKIVAWVEEQDALPEDNREWYQDDWLEQWSCGTVCCVAGKLALDAGWEPVWFGLKETCTVQRGGRERAVSCVASELLGVAEHEAELLFQGENTAALVRGFAEALAGECL